MRTMMMCLVLAAAGCGEREAETEPHPCCECLSNTNEALTGQTCLRVEIDTCNEDGAGRVQCACWNRCSEYCDVPSGCSD